MIQSKKLKIWKENNSWYQKMKYIYENKLSTILENYSYNNYRYKYDDENDNENENDENKYTQFIQTTVEKLKINDIFAEEKEEKKCKYIIGRIKHIFYSGKNHIIFIQNDKSIYMYNKNTIVYKVVSL